MLSNQTDRTRRRSKDDNSRLNNDIGGGNGSRIQRRGGGNSRGESHRYSRTPVIVVSSETSEAGGVGVDRCGADEIIENPSARCCVVNPEDCHPSSDVRHADDVDDFDVDDDDDQPATGTTTAGGGASGSTPLSYHDVTAASPPGVAATIQSTPVDETTTMTVYDDRKPSTSSYASTAYDVELAEFSREHETRGNGRDEKKWNRSRYNLTRPR